MNMNEKTVIVTGASSGIGKAAAEQLKAKGTNVVIIGRAPERTKAVGEALNAPYYSKALRGLRSADFL